MECPDPFIIVDEGDVSIFKSKIHAEQYLEPIDILDEGLNIYNHEGIEFCPAIELIEESGVERVKLVNSGLPRKPEELKRAIAQFLVRIDAPCDESFLLPDTIDILIRKTGYTR